MVCGERFSKQPYTRKHHSFPLFSDLIIVKDSKGSLPLKMNAKLYLCSTILTSGILTSAQCIRWSGRHFCNWKQFTEEWSPKLRSFKNRALVVTISSLTCFLLLLPRSPSSNISSRVLHFVRNPTLEPSWSSCSIIEGWFPILACHPEKIYYKSEMEWRLTGLQT
jgi:hypothetical protein